MKKSLIWILLVAVILASCAPAPVSTPQSTVNGMGTVNPSVTATPPVTEITVMTHDSFAISQEVKDYFVNESKIRVRFVKGGDGGSMLNRAILTKDAPQADVIYGVDSTFLSRALQAGIFEPYDAPALKNIAAEFQLDPQHRALPVDYGDVCINYDRNYFAEKNLDLPQTLEDLAKPAYKGLLVVENPATSSPGLAFLLATIAHFGPQGYLDYWKSLRENGVVVVNGWETAYYTNFSASSGKGAQPMVVSYASSPAAEVVYAVEKPLESSTASLVGDGMCYRQIEFVGIVKGTKNRAAAEAFVNFVLDQIFQEDMPLQMYVYPVVDGARIPNEFHRHTQSPEHPATLAPDLIDQNREQWIKDWMRTVLE